MNNGILAKGDDSVAMPYGWPIRRQRPDRIMPLPLGGSFDPRSIPGLHFWVDATNAASIVQRTGVARWESVSGVGSTVFSQSVANNQPLLGTMGSRRALAFRAGSWMATQGNSGSRTLMSNTNALSIYISFSRGVLPWAPVYSTGFGNGFQGIEYNFGNVLWAIRSSDADVFQTPIAIPSSLTSAVYPNAVGLRFDIQNAQYSSSINGTLVRNRVATNTVPRITAAAVASGESLGVSSGEFVGAVGEIFGYKRFLTDAEDAALGLYLRAKWGS